MMEIRRKDPRRPEVVCVDNFDSFVFNLVDELAKRGCGVRVFRNDRPAGELLEMAVRTDGPALALLSPGPGAPADAGCCVEFVRRAPASLPIFGVCLGHQAIVEAFGGRVGPAGQIAHGVSSWMTHGGEGLFGGLPTPMRVGRYHSLVGVEMPEELEVTARCGDAVMAIAHRTRPVAGVQFHPESVLTPLGGALIENVIAWAEGARGDARGGDHA